MGASNYPPAASERVMKVQEVILKAMSGKLTWLQAADILRMRPRSLRRWRWRYEQHGYDGLFDRRLRKPSPKRAPMAELERVLRLYRERYKGFNVRHFHEVLRREHDVTLSYSFVKKALQEAGLVTKRRPRGRHRLRREPRACFGEMLHIDGSPHAWLAQRPGHESTLIAVVDDATSRLLYAQLWPEETTEAVMSALRDVFERHGLPMALYTDRAGWAFHSTRGGGGVDKTKLTQVGRALAQLSVEHIPAYSPQARGRSERANRTLQDRLVNELRAAGIRSVEAANRYLRERFIARYSETFGRQPRDPESAFVPLGDADLDQILCHQESRTVAKDNTVVLDHLRLQLAKQPGRRSCERLQVTVRRHLDGSHSLWLGRRQLGLYDRRGRPQTQDPKGIAA
jgi:transposase